MPTAKISKCQRCGRVIRVSRKDTKWCSDRCRYRERQENAKFNVPKLPQSGHKGITFSRIKENWGVKIKEETKWKYVGSFKDLNEAIVFQKEIEQIDIVARPFNPVNKGV